MYIYMYIFFVGMQNLRYMIFSYFTLRDLKRTLLKLTQTRSPGINHLLYAALYIIFHRTYSSFNISVVPSIPITSISKIYKFISLLQYYIIDHNAFVCSGYFPSLRIVIHTRTSGCNSSGGEPQSTMLSA